MAADLGCNPRNSLELCSGTGYGLKFKTTSSERTSVPSNDGRSITLSTSMGKIQQIDSWGLIYLRDYYEHRLITDSDSTHGSYVRESRLLISEELEAYNLGVKGVSSLLSWCSFSGLESDVLFSGISQFKNP